MKLLYTAFFTVLSVTAVAQQKDLSTLPAYDCSLKKVMAIIGRPTIIVTPDKSTGLENIVNDYCTILGSNCIRKNETELTNADFLKNMLLVGIAADFKKWNQYKVAVKITGNAFAVNDKNFTDRADGFVYVDSNRIIVSGNSLKAVKDAQLALTGGHDILITQNGKITFFGNKKQQQFNWYNLQQLKTTNYLKKSSGLFSAVYVSKNFKDTIDYSRLNTSLKLYAKQFLSIYKIKIPEKKVSWFLHSSMLEYGTMSGMFGLTCPGNNSAGFSIRGEIHTNGYNTGLVKHEYAHFLFDNTIPQDNNPAFFVEGCVEYITNINDSALYTHRITIAKKYKDSLNYRDLIINNKDFYGQYSDANYAVCGVFVKYIIEKFGVSSFKKYCLAGKKLIATKEIFNTEFEDIIKGYKNWLQNE